MTQISVRLPDDVVAQIDAAVAEGRAPSRTAYLLGSLVETQRRERAERDAAIIAACNGQPYPDLDGLVEWAAGNYPGIAD